MFEFQNVFAEVFICPETMELLQKSLRETHFEATVTRFEFSLGFSRKSGPGILWQRAETSRFYCESGSPRGVQGKSGRQSWSQAKDGRSCGGPTGEFAPVKVENEFADGKIC